MEHHSSQYSEKSFKDKLRDNFKAAGKVVVHKALLLYHVLKNPKTSLIDRAIIVAALGYFIFPFDAIADILVGIGYSDDLAVLAGAVTRISANITPEIEEKATNDMNRFLGDKNTVINEDV